jgi:LDH2 family malate/lactate/ureidoglycolate dehydrogenase
VSDGAPAARYRAADLLSFAQALLARAGLPDDRAHVVAEVLLEGDLLGRNTHGLALLPRYLDELVSGRMAREGDPEVVADHGAAITWDGRHLPGPWLVRRAIATARERLASQAIVSIAIRRSHHIACLQAYLKPVTDAGHVIVLTCSDPSVGGVTPHGGVASRITPNPIAAGFPTAGDPVLIDISLSTTSNAMTKRTYDEGGRLPGPWVVGADGRATDDPSVVFGNPPGAVLPLGGLDLGHKGYGLALLVEALTSGLAGHGRADAPKEWGASVFLLLLEPAAFGGREAFLRQTSHLVELCRTTPVAPGQPPVRVPGEAALARRARQLREGVELHRAIRPALHAWAERYGLSWPIAAASAREPD